MILYDKLKKDVNGKEFMKTRELITNIFYGMSMVLYILFWIIKHPDDSPTFSVYLTCIMCPLFTIGLYGRSYYYLFTYNWLHALYLSVTLITFFIFAMSVNIPNYSHYILYEVGHLIIANIAGMLISIMISLPFKIIHYHFFGANKFYYDSTILENLDKYLYPENYEEENKKIKEKFEYDSFNETQLQAELQLAIKEERFEAAEKIRKLLETKFR